MVARSNVRILVLLVGAAALAGACESDGSTQPQYFAPQSDTAFANWPSS